MTFMKQMIEDTGMCQQRLKKLQSIGIHKGKH